MYTSPNTIRIIKTNMKWAMHVADMGEKRTAYKNLERKAERRGNLENVGVA
jgi:hypothetical protein